MNPLVEKALFYYGDLIRDDFKKSDIYQTLERLANKAGFMISIETGYTLDEFKLNKSIVLSVNVVDETLNEVASLDEGTLNAYMIIVFRKRKDQLLFFDWTDDDFIESINMIIEDLKARVGT